MKIPSILFLGSGLLWSSFTSAGVQPLYSARSRDKGIDAFDVTVTETKRTERTSTLHVPGFQDRSAAASRWLMCTYGDLAVQRGFKYVAVVYPTPPSEDVLVGFPNSSSEDLVKTLGPEFRGEPLKMSADTLIPICGIGPPGEPPAAFATALASAKANEATGEGGAFDTAVGQQFGARHADTVDRCVKNASGENLAEFNLVMKLDESGGVVQAMVYPETAVAKCVQTAVAHDTYKKPAHAGYWVRVEMSFRP